MNEFLSSVHRYIFERSLNLFDFWCVLAIGALAAEYSAWFWLMLIPCVMVSITEQRKL